MIKLIQKALITAVFIQFLVSGSVTGNDSIRTFVPSASYTGDVAGSFQGGIKKGIVYLGMLNLSLTSRLWKGSCIYIGVSNTHGSIPSSELFGDYQVASNIEAGNHTYLQELWISQSFKKGELTIGLQDFNVDFANTETGSDFLNSSFGIMPTISGNVPAPIFPLTSLGITTNWNILKNTSLLLALYDGKPTDFSDNPHNLNWAITRKDGILFFSELQYETQANRKHATIKAGYYVHRHFFLNKAGAISDSACPNTYGLYLLGEKEFWHNESGKTASFFFQTGISPDACNQNKYYLGFGLHVTGIITPKKQDIAGIAVAHDGINNYPGKETSIEVFWKFSPVKYFFVQPDFQYIINPSGTGKKLNNCMAGILRVGLLL